MNGKRRLAPSFPEVRGRPELNRQPPACTYPRLSSRRGLYLHHRLPSVGAPVSSLYGAPRLIHMGFPRYSHIYVRLSLHRYPGEFQFDFRAKSCITTGGCSNQLSYGRIICRVITLLMPVQISDAFAAKTWYRPEQYDT